MFAPKLHSAFADLVILGVEIQIQISFRNIILLRSFQIELHRNLHNALADFGHIER